MPRSNLWRACLVIALGMLWSRPAAAATPYQPRPDDALLERWRWTEISELDGQEFQSMTESPDGSMWFGLGQGAARYDGTHWVHYSSADGLFAGSVSAIWSSSRGQLFAGAETEIARNPAWCRDGQWRPLLNQSPEAHPIAVFNFCEGPDGSVWASLGFLLLRIQGDSFTIYGGPDCAGTVGELCPSARFVALPVTVAPEGEGWFCGYVLADREGRVWTADMVGGWQVWDAARGPAEDVQAWQAGRARGAGPEVWGPLLCQTQDGAVWLAYRANSWTLTRIDPASGDIRGIDLRRFGNLSHVAQLVPRPDGELWITGHSGLLTGRPGQWRLYRNALLGISPGAFRWLDGRGDAGWLGVENGRVYRIDGSPARWQSYRGLHFQCDGPDLTQWFVAVDGAVIGHGADGWVRYDEADGLMSDPVVVLCSRAGRLWAAGSHQGTAATAYYDRDHWIRQVHPQLSWTIDYRSAHQLADGSLLFGANNETITGRAFEGGMVRAPDPTSGPVETEHLRPPAVPQGVVGIVEPAPGRLVIGGLSVQERFESGWQVITNPPQFASAWIDAVGSAPGGVLWVAKGGVGLFRVGSAGLSRFDQRSGLADNTISTLLCRRDGTLWAATAKGVSRFDGRSWTPLALGPDFVSIDREAGTLREDRDGRLWFNIATRNWYFRAKPGAGPAATNLPSFRTISYVPDRAAPETELILAPSEVSQPGNTVIGWCGRDRWEITSARCLQYSYRFDGGDWSAFTPETNRMFSALASGAHSFEVRARDLDLNVDPTPAGFRFRVIPPVWKQPWFLAVVGVLAGASLLQTGRVIARGRTVRKSVAALHRTNESLRREIAERTRMAAEVEKVHRQLVNASRRAGMAEVATGVLHNVGNVLNSVNVSASLLGEQLRGSRVDGLERLVALLNEHEPDLGRFIGADPRGRQLPGYLRALWAQLQNERRELLAELERLDQNVGHLKQIVAVQQDYAHASGVREQVLLEDLAEDSLQMQGEAFLRHRIQVHREFGAHERILVDRHKVVQILFNLLANAKQACLAASVGLKEIRVRTTAQENTVRVEVTDNGVGITPENLTRIFQHGFTTRKDGHGFGLHSSALAARELGGTLVARSDGPGRGATFVLELPRHPAPSNGEAPGTGEPEAEAVNEQA